MSSADIDKAKANVDKAKAKSNDALTQFFNSPVDKAITRIVKVLSSAAGVDATFCLLGYGAVLTSAQLQIITRYIAKTTTKERLLSIALSAKNLSALCSDVRTVYASVSILSRGKLLTMTRSTSRSAGV